MTSQDTAFGVATPRAHWLTTSTRVGLVAWLAAMVPTILGLVLLAAFRNAPVPDSYGFRGFPAVFAVTNGTIGAIILSRRPGNRVGLVLASIGVLAGILTLVLEYANAGLVGAPGGFPGAVWAAWLAAWIWVPLVVLMAPGLISIYPDGHFLSARWRRIGLASGIGGVLAVVVLATRPGPLENFATADNPIGVLPVELADGLFGLAMLLIVGQILVATASMLVRYRRADRDSREQLKWFALAALVLALVSNLPQAIGKAGEIAFIVAAAGIPVATGIAVLRYRLYDIDTVINRAIVYGLLTAILAGVYSASVGLTERAFQAITGAGSDAGVVVATIVIVAVFTPLKSGVQRLVDKRFKEATDTPAHLRRFLDELDARLSPLEPRRVLRRFLTVAIEATRAVGGEIEVVSSVDPGLAGWIAEVDRSAGGPTADVAAEAGGLGLRLGLVMPARGSVSGPDRAALEQALESVAGELG